MTRECFIAELYLSHDDTLGWCIVGKRGDELAPRPTTYPTFELARDAALGMGYVIV